MRLWICLVLLSAGGCGGNGASATGGGPGDGGALPDSFVASDGPGAVLMGDKAVITMASFPVGAGQEVYMCQTFANPFGGDAEIATFHSSMTQGSHHMLLLYEDNASNGALTSCDGLTFGPMPYAAQQPEAEVSFPAGIAALIKSTQGFRIVSHFLNATPNPLTANIQVVLTRAAPGTITQHAGVFFLNNVRSLLPPNGIPPNTTKTISASYTTTQPMSLLYAAAHMHQRSQNLTATFGSTTLYSTNSWDNAPFQTYAPPLMLPAGATITWSCTVANDTSQTLYFGESAQTNEMCIFDGQYFPVANDASPSLLVTK